MKQYKARIENVFGTPVFDGIATLEYILDILDIHILVYIKEL